MGKIFSAVSGGFRRFVHAVADYTRETNKLLLILCIVASLIGCGLIYSAVRANGSTRTVIVQLGAVLIGVIAAVGVSLVDYNKVSKYPLIFVAIEILLLVVTFFFGYAPEGTENKAWIELPLGMSIQVSEVIKILMILTFSHHVQSIPKDEINRPKNVILLGIHGLLPPIAVMAMQRDLGTVTIMLFICLFMLYAAGVKLRWFVGAIAAIAAASPLIWFYGLSEYMRQRFTIIFNLESDAQGLGYQQLLGLNAIGSGGIFGEGYLHGTYTQAGLPPKAYNDFIFTVAGNEFGLVGCITIILILIAIIVKIMIIGVQSKDIQGKVICFGVFGMFASQILINIGMVLSLLPVIGVTLPFFSAGGSSLVMLFVSVGLVLSVYRNRYKRTAYIDV